MIFLDCNKTVQVGIDKSFWVDASNESNIDVFLYYVDMEFSLLEEMKVDIQYLENNLWKGTIPSPTSKGFVIGKVITDGKNSFFVVNYDMYGSFIYQSAGLKEGLKLEWLQLGEKAQVIDYGNLKEIGMGFYGGTLNNKIPSIVCIDDICNVFRVKEIVDCSDAQTEEELKECLKQNEELLQKYLLLEKELEKCNQNKTIVAGQPIIHGANIASSTEIKHVNTQQTKEIPQPSPRVVTHIKTSLKTSIETSSTTNISNSQVKTTLK